MDTSKDQQELEALCASGNLPWMQTPAAAAQPGAVIGNSASSAVIAA